jgi:hypothetical protein
MIVMVEAPLAIIFKMAVLFLTSAIDTAVEMFQLFIDLINSLGYTIAVAGPLGLVVAVAIILPIIYFMSKFFGDTLKTVIFGIAIVIIVFSIIAVLV